MNELRADVQSALRSKIAPEAIVIAVSQSERTHPDGLEEGVVAWVRDEPFAALVVHRWGRRPDQPIWFWSGWYGGDARGMIEDYEARSGQAWP